MGKTVVGVCGYNEIQCIWPKPAQHAYGGCMRTPYTEVSSVTESVELYGVRRGPTESVERAVSAVNVCPKTVGMPPKPSQTFIMTQDIALKHSIGAKPSIHTALMPEALPTVIMHHLQPKRRCSQPGAGHRTSSRGAARHRGFL